MKSKGASRTELWVIHTVLKTRLFTVWGGGGVPGGCAAFCVSFFRATVFCVGFFNSPMPFLGQFYQYLHIFSCIFCVFHQKVKPCFVDKIFVMYN